MNGHLNFSPFPYFGGARRSTIHAGECAEMSDDRPQICASLTNQGYYHNNTIHRASPFHRTIFNPRETPYSKVLKEKGYIHPSHNREGIEYTNVHGNEAKVNPNFPIAIVTYCPRKTERYFQTMEQAMNELPHSGDWQVLNLITMEILIEPPKALLLQ